ncbi:hypothetical protein CCHL11_08992 [Colletotrichum chlorophyti]|uniref:Uncharacterized protein n=1 Tax=Colletotrichum chlorophyti TaxID=708187 RepID=A0A1Q8RWW8_9PEZI|nr:hypothetical protein CCHL11_08992 [Colletotrichum chlorophyti]
MAAPTPEATKDGAEGLFSAPLHLDIDDIILYGVNGEYKVIKEAEFNNLTESGILVYGGNDKADAPELSDALALEARQDCPGLNTEFVITSVQDFLDWDIQISPVVGAIQAPVTIAVTRGYSVSNSLTVGGGITGAYKAISLQLKIDYDWTWTTTDTTMISYPVPEGHYGVVISQPWTHRVYGELYTSCTTDNWKKSTFMASSHTSQSFGNLNWVRGVFRICASKQYPIPFCNGNGHHR